MRSSRVSRDAARLFDRGSASSTPRRNTRSALAGFAHHAAGPLPADLVTPDIEDGMAASPAKRRRRSYASRASRDVVEADGEGDKHTAAKSSPRRARKPPTPKPAGQAAGSPTASVPPSGWAEVYDAVRAMRSPGGVAHGAAVDTMGCERLADEGASELDRRFQTLVALMLSSQTKDTVNAVAMERLKRELPACREGSPPGLNLDNVLAVDAERLNELIWAVGFHNNKTKYLKQAAEMLRDRWNGDIPDTIEGLTSLPGVGPKMAHLCLSAAWGRTEGIGVDVHVHRITNLWGWNKTRTPEETRVALQSWLPRDRWREINTLLVGLGQTVCLPVGRRCGQCELGLRGLCKAAEHKKVTSGRRAKAEGMVTLEQVKREEAELEEVKREEIKFKPERVLAEQEVVLTEAVVEEPPRRRSRDPAAGRRLATRHGVLR